MTTQPRMLANGTPCCAIGSHLCDECIDHFSTLYAAELRANSTAENKGHTQMTIELTTDEFRACSVELQRRDPQFVRIVSANRHDSVGEYEIRSATTNKVLRRTFTFDGERIITPLFDAEQHARMAADAYAPPASYADGLNKLRTAAAAASTPASRFEDAYKQQRTREFEEEYARAARDRR